MNIFYLSSDPQECAKFHCDKHVVKMVTETAQILSNVLLSLGFPAPYKWAASNPHPYQWALKSRANYIWLCYLGYFLGMEYERRYNKVHKALSAIAECFLYADEIPEGVFTEPPQSMPDDVKRESCIEAYREYYRVYKRYFARWKTEVPEWF